MAMKENPALSNLHCSNLKMLISQLDNCNASSCQVCTPPPMRPTKRARLDNQETIKKTDPNSQTSGLRKDFIKKSRYYEFLKNPLITNNVTVSDEMICCGDNNSEVITQHEDTRLRGSNKVDASLLDVLTADQIEQHVRSLGKVTKEMSAHGVGKSLCQLCGIDKLSFNPAPIYCCCCDSPIKRNLIYHWTSDEMGGKNYFCGRCLRKSKGKIVSLQGLAFAKSSLLKGNKIEEDEESWVQCDKCECWQHQICALYNSKRDSEGKEEYACPSCRLQELKIGKDKPIYSASGAKDLPCTKLSDHIEQRLFRRLKEERQERAISTGKCVDEVPGAENIFVRVVLSKNRLVKVKQQFLDIFHGENYPAEFPYKSKVILLFQKINGVDVCLFGMFVQEYGSDCLPPNQRSVYISYLDSVKYFQPDIRTVHGEALRTLVYHEILIGYLDYCKKLGFETCYIWACPPMKGDDYIFNCHPETQRTPKPDKLRHWYKSMLLKAKKERVVLGSTNFYDRFFVPNAQCSTRVTAANLPYFEGAYWSSVSEELSSRIGKEGENSAEMANKLMSKRALQLMGHTSLSAKSTTDIIVMQQLGQDIYKVKEDFLVLQLQFICSTCHKSILSPNHWICAKCKSFRVCPSCIKIKQRLREKTHFIGDEQHALSEILVDSAPQNTDEGDLVLDTDIFENRNSFLSFCRENHYQFDFLRHAKYSSMMILYHLHKRISLGLATFCGVCQKGTVINDGWRCEVCPGIIVCSTCYQREGNHAHIHQLAQPSSMTECGTKDKQWQKQLQKMELEKEEVLKTIDHAFLCHHSKEHPCFYPRCLQLRKLFRHLSICTLSVAGGCNFCRIAWTLLHLHSRNCKVADCQVPNCQSIKMSRNLKANQADTRPHASVKGLAANITNEWISQGCTGVT